jgi:hypothetical protein
MTATISKPKVSIIIIASNVVMAHHLLSVRVDNPLSAEASPKEKIPFHLYAYVLQVLYCVIACITSGLQRGDKTKKFKFTKTYK